MTEKEIETLTADEKERAEILAAEANVITELFYRTTMDLLDSKKVRPAAIVMGLTQALDALIEFGGDNDLIGTINGEKMTKEVLIEKLIIPILMGVEDE